MKPGTDRSPGTIPPSGHPGSPAAQIDALVASVSRALLGKEEVVRRAVLTLVAGGHLLLEDVPGVGKTLLAKALAKCLSADFKRIQFTADLLPSDVTGVTVYAPDRQEFTFRPGPVFTNILLGDEINRATPRTQSSLLEAMEEECVTVDGLRHRLPLPFFVMATQNPVELEGTYALPFAQMDRFMLRLSIGYLDRAHEVAMLQAQRETDPLAGVEPVMTCAAWQDLQARVRQIRVVESLQGYLVDLVQATRRADTIEFGASPRASLDLQRFSQAAALAAGRDHVLPDDIKLSARLLLPHRLISQKGGRNTVLHTPEVLHRILDTVPVPI